MELRDYGIALRRYWVTWTAVAVAGVLAALVVVLVSRPTYQATAQVFVASATDSSNSGAQFVNQRVTSYPDVADSRTVLGPVITELGLRESFQSLQARVSATNPTGTSQIDIAVSDTDPVRATAVANAVADRFRSAVEDLERSGNASSPVQLTVTNPATVPAAPAFPKPGLLFPLGLVVGLALGAAAAIVRSRRDTRLHTADDVRAAWGNGAAELVVHSSPARRRRRSRLIGRPATLLARQLEPVAEQRPVRVVAVAPSANAQRSVHGFTQDVAAELAAWQVPARVTDPDDVSAAEDGPGVQLAVETPSTSVRDWRRIARSSDVVIVVPPGRVDRAELAELRSVLAAAGARVLAVVLPPRRRDRAAAAAAPQRPASGTPRPAGAVPAQRRSAVPAGSR
jgi:capsular polysaccharide biosynthesis protein